MNDLINNLKSLHNSEIFDLKDTMCKFLFNKSFNDVEDIIKDSKWSEKTKDELLLELSDAENSLEYYEKYDDIFEKIKSDDYILLNKHDYPNYYTLNDLSSKSTERDMIRIIKKLNNETAYLCIDLKNELFVISKKVFEDKYLKKS